MEKKRYTSIWRKAKQQVRSPNADSASLATSPRWRTAAYPNSCRWQLVGAKCMQIATICSISCWPVPLITYDGWCVCWARIDSQCRFILSFSPFISSFPPPCFNSDLNMHIVLVVKKIRHFSCKTLSLPCIFSRVQKLMKVIAERNEPLRGGGWRTFICDVSS